MGYWEPDRHVAIQTRSKTAALMDVTRQGTRMGWISSPARRHRPWYMNSNPEVTPHMPRDIYIFTIIIMDDILHCIIDT